MTRQRRLLGAAFLAFVLVMTSGCATMAVHPWDRDLLSERKMRFNPSPVENAVDEHVYFSKEGSMGGQSAAGGGCGCN